MSDDRGDTTCDSVDRGELGLVLRTLCDQCRHVPSKLLESEPYFDPSATILIAVAACVSFIIFNRAGRFAFGAVVNGLKATKGSSFNLANVLLQYNALPRSTQRLIYSTRRQDEKYKDMPPILKLGNEELRHQRQGPDPAGSLAATAAATHQDSSKADASDKAVTEEDGMEALKRQVAGLGGAVEAMKLLIARLEGAAPGGKEFCGAAADLDVVAGDLKNRIVGLRTVRAVKEHEDDDARGDVETGSSKKVAQEELHEDEGGEEGEEGEGDDKTILVTEPLEIGVSESGEGEGSDVEDTQGGDLEAIQAFNHAHGILSADWVDWFEQQPDTSEIAQRLKDDVTAYDDAQQQGDQLDTCLFFIMQVGLAIVVIFEYFFLPLQDFRPEGHWYYCSGTYLVSIVMFKPFTIPMWLVLTLTIHQSFVESIYGGYAKFRNGGGSIVSAPLPRNTLVVGAMGLVVALYVVWLAAAIAMSGGLVLIFAPALCLLVVVVPLACILVGEGVANRVAKVLNPDMSARPVSTETCRTFDETILILKASTTQLMAMAVLALPLLEFIRGDAPWSEGALDVLRDSIWYDHIKVQFLVSFAWPDFTFPRLRVEFLVGFALIIIQYGMRLLKAGLRAVVVYTRWLRRGSHKPRGGEYWMLRLLPSITYKPFFGLLTVTRATLQMYVMLKNSGFASNTFMALALVGCPCVMCAATLRGGRTKEFTADDKELEAFFRGEECAVYTDLHMDMARASRLPAGIKSCVWLRRIEIDSFSGDFKVLESLPNLEEIEFGDIFCRPVGDIASFSGLENLKSLTCFECNNLTGDLSSLAKLKKLERVELRNFDALTGDMAVLAELENVTQLVLTGCINLTGDVSVFSGRLKMSKLVLSGCDLTGDVSAFAALENLTELDLTGCINLTGNVAAFLKQPNLDVLNLTECEKLTGTEDDVAKLKSKVRRYAFLPRHLDPTGELDVDGELDSSASESEFDLDSDV